MDEEYNKNLPKIKIIKRIFGSFHKSRDEYLFCCPLCKDIAKKKLSINFEKNKWKCWVCNSSGKSISYLIQRFGNSDDRKDWKEFDERIDISDFMDTVEQLLEGTEQKYSKKKIELPAQAYSLNADSLNYNGQIAIRYLLERGVEKNDILKYMMMVCQKGDYFSRIIIPSFDINGDLNYFVARTFNPNYSPYKNPSIEKSRIIWNELFLDFTRPMVIVEGVFDAIQAGDNAVPLLGSSLNENHLLFQRIVDNGTQISLALDKDAKEKQFHIARKLLKYGIDVSIIDIGDKKDIGCMTKKEFAVCKRDNISQFTSDNQLLSLLGVSF